MVLWKAQQHNLISEIRTKDTLLDQCLNLRRIYEHKHENYKTLYPGLKSSDIYDAVCGVKAAVKGGLSPAEQLLRDANFTYMKKDDKNEYYGTMYPHIRAFGLKDKATWDPFHRLMKAYQEAEIPHPYMPNAIESLNKMFKDLKEAGPSVTKKVTRILKENR